MSHCMNKISTPTTAELARFAGLVIGEVMSEGLASGKHTQGDWNEGAALDPRWHLFRASRHALDSLGQMDGVSLDKIETAYDHAIRAATRAVMASYQLSESCGVSKIPTFR